MLYIKLAAEIYCQEGMNHTGALIRTLKGVVPSTVTRRSKESLVIFSVNITTAVLVTEDSTWGKSSDSSGNAIGSGKASV